MTTQLGAGQLAPSFFPLIMDRQLPSTTYNGVTVLLDKPGRHDRARLIDAWAGKLFDDILAGSGVVREQLEIRTVACKSPLLPGTKVILALGSAALKQFRHDVSLNEQRGCPLLWQGKVVIPSYTPQDATDRKAYGQQDKKTDHGTEKDHQQTQRKNWLFWLEKDTTKALRIAASGLRKPELTLKPIYQPSISELTERLLGIKDDTLFVDIETTETQQLTCLGIGWAVGKDFVTYVLPWTDYRGERSHQPIHQAKFLRALSVAFSRNKVVAHNGGFDFFVLAWKYKILLPREPEDTMLMHHRRYIEVEKSLGHLGSLYTDELYHKNEGVFMPRNPTQERQLWEYNAKDVYLTALCWRRLWTGASEDEIASMRQANEMIRPHLIMQLQGLRLNIPKLESIVADHELRERAYERVLRLLTGFPLNARSPQQVSHYLYKDQKQKRPAKDPTNEKSLLQVYNRSKLPSIKVILALRSARKAASALDFNRWRGERTTCSYAIAGTTTLRLGSKTLLKFGTKKSSGYGTNMQNWGKANRACIISDPGKLLFQVDQSGAEAMMVAYLSRRGNYQLLMEEGIKSHVFVAMHIFASHWASVLGLSSLDDYLHAPIPKLRSLPQWKQLDTAIKASGLKYATAKMVCHASNYDMKAPTFQMQAMVKSNNQLILTLNECNRLLETYHRLFPEIRESYHAWTRGKIKMDRTLHNLFGYPRVFNGHLDDALFKEAYAFRPQSSSGVLSHKVLCEVQRRIESDSLHGGCFDGVDLLQNGHDSIMGQAPVDTIKPVVKEIMNMFNVTFKGLEREFTMRSEAGIGKNWKPKSEDNPDGLDEDLIWKD